MTFDHWVISILTHLGWALLAKGKRAAGTDIRRVVVAGQEHMFAFSFHL